MCSSGRVVDIADSGGALSHGQNVRLYSPIEPTSQKFNIVALGQNQYRISMKESAGLYLASYGNSNGTSTGTSATSAGNIYLSSYVGEMYQHWMFELLENPPSATAPIGCLESVSSTSIEGWAYKSSTPNTPLDVHIYITNNSTGAQVGVATTANIYRASLATAGYGDGYHAFKYNINWKTYKPGTYTVRAYAIDVSNGNPQLTNAKTFTVRNATGAVEYVNGNGVGGWAWKPDAPNAVIDVHIYLYKSDGTQLVGYATTANQARSDLAALGYGNGVHGFSKAIDWSSFPEERLRVDVFAVDGSGNNPPIYSGYYDNRKKISLLGMLENIYFHDLSEWSWSTNVETYCENIGCSYLFRTNRADSASIRTSIKNSSYCVICTHGSNDGEGILWSMKNIYNEHIDCQNQYCSTCYGWYTTEDLEGLNSNYFDTTRCVVLMACYSGLNGAAKPDNMVNTLHSKGVRTVVGFKTAIYYYYDNYDPNLEVHSDDIVSIDDGAQLWITLFTKYLGEGYTVTGAKNKAYLEMVEANLEKNNKTEDDLPYLSENFKKESIYCGMDSCYIKGEEYQIVKH